MKIIVLSGAYLNAGDFLILQRAKALLLHVFPDAELREIDRKLDLTPFLDEINASQLMVFAGGPGYVPNVYPNGFFRLIPDLNQITTPMLALGLGWYGENPCAETIFNYRFSPDTLRLWRRVERDGLTLGCRDQISARVLRQNGISDVAMTGCPAWYDLQHVDSVQLRPGLDQPFRKICISDPALLSNYEVALDLLAMLQRRYPAAELHWIYHRSLPQDCANYGLRARWFYQKFQRQTKKYKLQIHDISGSAEGFHQYDDCDLHIGFRVHAHLYNLSIRNRSILIVEDGRGAAANATLQLPALPAPVWQPHTGWRGKLNRCLTGHRNPDLISTLKDYLECLQATEDRPLRDAFATMRDHYQMLQKQLLHARDKIQIRS